MVEMGMICSVNFHDMYDSHSYGNESLIIKMLFSSQFSITTCSNDNALEWILWRKWDCRSLTMTIKLVKIYSYQNYTNFPLPFPTFSTDYQTCRNRWCRSLGPSVEGGTGSLGLLVWRSFMYARIHLYRITLALGL